MCFGLSKHTLWPMLPGFFFTFGSMPKVDTDQNTLAVKECVWPFKTRGIGIVRVLPKHLFTLFNPPPKGFKCPKRYEIRVFEHFNVSSPRVKNVFSTFFKPAIEEQKGRQVRTGERQREREREREREKCEGFENWIGLSYWDLIERCIECIMVSRLQTILFAETPSLISEILNAIVHVSVHVCMMVYGSQMAILM